MSLLAGCASPTNPTFPVTRDQARRDLANMTAHPVALRRPVLVLGGWSDPGIMRRQLDALIRSGVSDPDDVVGENFFFCFSFEQARRRVLALMEDKFPLDREYPAAAFGSGGLKSSWTREVDVVAFSMGGVVARFAAAPPPLDAADPTRLRIHTLYTISSPHRGATLARLPFQGPMGRAMRPGSAMLDSLAWDRSVDPTPYPIVPYARLRDVMVGAGNASPWGRGVWWVPSPWLSRPHGDALKDPRIVADILRQLRGEARLVRGEPATLP